MNLYMKNYYHILLLLLLSIIAGGATCFFFIKENYVVSIIFLLVTIGLFSSTCNAIFKIFRDVEFFVEAIKYRDFSKRYAESKNKKDNFYHYFNDITNTFLSLSRENETQQQYLKKILELVDTGILAYDIENFNTLWMNESLKNMLKIPHVKNINWLQKRYEVLHKELIEIPLGENRLLSINVGNQIVKSLTNACTFETNGRTYKLIAFHNINATLEEVEANSWKGLLSVMTHEIMNSVAPVASLADTLKKMIHEEIKRTPNPAFEDIEIAMETIRRRSEGLLKFAETYRNLSKTIIPQIAPENLKEIVNDVHQLMQPSLKQKGISLEIKTGNSLLPAKIDRNLIEQVLINFITNATHAVNEKENPQIIIFSGITNEGNPYITVADNGKGISAEIRDQIFIPFFSTRKNGSGIGLSLSREIVKLHKGTLQVQSKEGEGSAFTILFSN